MLTWFLNQTHMWSPNPILLHIVFHSMCTFILTLTVFTRVFSAQLSRLPLFIWDHYLHPLCVNLFIISDTFCCMEVDTFGHFYMKAKTNTCCSTADPVWNQEFEIDLEGSQTLRILCYKQKDAEDILLGKSALEVFDVLICRWKCVTTCGCWIASKSCHKLPVVMFYSVNTSFHRHIDFTLSFMVCLTCLWGLILVKFELF